MDVPQDSLRLWIVLIQNDTEVSSEKFMYQSNKNCAGPVGGGVYFSRLLQGKREMLRGAESLIL